MLKKIIGLIVVLSALNVGNATAAEPQHLLDGTTMTYRYTTGSGIRLEIDNGMLSYEWLSGPPKGRGNKDLPYMSRKIGPKEYIFSWLEESNPDFITLIFNFENNTVYSSGLVKFGTDKQRIAFDAGVIDTLTLIEKQ